jgi:peptidoglycan/xylan/chitin deacetylase (PgdA/CDA1 family)
LALRDSNAVSLGVGALVGAAGAYWLPATAAISASARRVFGVRARVDGAAGVVLTFDDGPHPQGTPAVLELLAAAGAPATFFLAAEQVERYPSLAADVAAAGHEVGVHCYRHRNLMWRTPRWLEDDLRHAESVIGEATGAPLRLYRPPLGIVTTAALKSARRRGWEIVLWTRDGHDWEARATPTSITRRIMRDVSGGDVLLLHDADYYSAPASWRRTAAALLRILEELARRGLPPVRLPNAATHPQTAW